jgi:hypothetical protein
MKDRKLRCRRITAHDNFICIEGIACNLQLQVVLIRPLPGTLARGPGPPADRARRLFGLFERVRYALHPEHATIDRHGPVGDVTDGKHVRIADRSRVEVDHHAARAFQAGLFRQLVIRMGAHADDNGILKGLVKLMKAFGNCFPK